MRKQFVCFICEALDPHENICCECQHAVCEKHYLNGLDPVQQRPIKGCFLCVGKQPRVAMNKFHETAHAN